MLEKIHYNSKPVHRVTAECAFCSEWTCSEGALALRWNVLTSSMGERSADQYGRAGSGKSPGVRTILTIDDN